MRGEPTREEVASATKAAFAHGTADRADLLAAAVGTAASTSVFQALLTLPHRRYADVDELWPDLQRNRG